MNRLSTELQRLYLPPRPARQDTDTDTDTDTEAYPGTDGARLVDADGQVRALVLDLARPADWASLARVWHGVQVDLELPAPAIAVSGHDGVQLWFSLARPVPAAQGWAFLDALRQRYLGDVKPHRIGLMPQVDAAEPATSATTSPATSAATVRHARLVPALQPDTGRWSAFVAPDLAPVFAEEPWLDSPPNPDGQAHLLSQLACILPGDLTRAMTELQPPAVPTPLPAAPPAPPPAPARADMAAPGTGPGPRHFLRGVMNDASVDLALRIEAAKALLAYGDGDA